MSLFRGFTTAVKSLFDYKGRSFLALLGMMISSLLIVFLLSALYNFKTGVEGQVQGFGLKEIVAVPGRLFSKNGAMNTDLTQLLSFTSMNSTLTYKDAIDVQKEVPHVEAVAPQAETVTHVQYGNKDAESIYTGTTPGFSKIFRISLDEGRWLNQSDMKHLSRVIVLGALTKQELFGHANAIGKKVTVKGVTFTVVGVLHEKQLIGFNFDERAYTSYPLLIDTTSVTNASMIFFGVDNQTQVNPVRDAIDGILTRNHGTKDFGLVNADIALHVIDIIMKMVTAVTSAIAAVSFLVSGIGIMNVMLLVVKERTREIGLRKAVGARSYQVLLQFLSESALLSAVGAVLGTFGGYGLLRLAGHLYPALPVKFPLYIPEISIGFSIAIGLIFGVIPAFRAVRVQPVDALRYE